MNAVAIPAPRWLTTSQARDVLNVSHQGFFHIMPFLQRALEHRQRLGSQGGNYGYLWLEEDVERLARIHKAIPRISLSRCCEVLIAIERGLIA
jgi:hypothetical protein